jgi:hypothetical protein
MTPPAWLLITVPVAAALTKIALLLPVVTMLPLLVMTAPVALLLTYTAEVALSCSAPVAVTVRVSVPVSMTGPLLLITVETVASVARMTGA